MTLKPGFPKFALALLIFAAASDARAQMSIGEQRLSEPMVGSSIGKITDAVSRPFVGRSILPPPHLDPAGKVCLTVGTLVRRQTTVTNVYDQLLVLDNRCGSEIRIKACYYNTTSCTIMSAAPYKRAEKILGAFPSDYFRYSYQEYVR